MILKLLSTIKTFIIYRAMLYGSLKIMRSALPIRTKFNLEERRKEISSRKENNIQRKAMISRGCMYVQLYLGYLSKRMIISLAIINNLPSLRPR